MGPRILDRHRRGLLRPRTHAAFRQVPVLLTHHFRHVDDATGVLMGALSDLQAQRALQLLGEAGVAVDYRSFEQMGHSMHGQDPQLFTETLVAGNLHSSARAFGAPVSAPLADLPVSSALVWPHRWHPASPRFPDLPIGRAPDPRNTEKSQCQERARYSVSSCLPPCAGYTGKVL